MTSKKENPYLKQVSGTHYMYMEIQPAEFINKNKSKFNSKDLKFSSKIKK